MNEYNVKKSPIFVRGLKKIHFLSEEIPVHKIETLYGQIYFSMFGETTEFRVRTFFSKEPETLAWIDEFKSGDVLWDIGANIGCYSLYAAKRTDLKVCAFEPSPVNFWLLTANAAMNNFGARLLAYPFALSDKTKMAQWVPHLSPGSADNQLLREGCLAMIQIYSIDELIRIGAAPFPTHMKLDVDGIESLIITGAKKTLADERLLSIMIEMDENDEATTNNIVTLLMQSGFEKPVTRHSPYFENNHYLPFANYIFQRK